MGSSRVVFASVLYCLTGLGLTGLGLAYFDGACAAEAQSSEIARVTYHLQPGDVLDISVWKEQDLQREILIRPDGGFTFPLAGEVDASGKSTEDIRTILVDRLKRYVPTPVVTVAVKQIGGNRIYVLGKVVHAGEFPFSNSLDVMQAISLAGGTTPFAAVNDIVILRRQNGRQHAFSFHYSDVARGRELAQNIQLQSGDTVVVP
jgi:polysaccharide export outer membrane protein